MAQLKSLLKNATHVGAMAATEVPHGDRKWPVSSRFLLQVSDASGETVEGKDNIRKVEEGLSSLHRRPSAHSERYMYEWDKGK